MPPNRTSSSPSPPRTRTGVRIETSTQPIGNALIEFDTPPTPTRARHTGPPARFASSSAPAARVLQSPYPAHAPLSCDGGRPSHGRAALLLVVDQRRTTNSDGARAVAGEPGSCLCVVGPQGRQIAPLHTHLACLLLPAPLPRPRPTGLSSARCLVGGRGTWAVERLSHESCETASGSALN